MSIPFEDLFEIEQLIREKFAKKVICFGASSCYEKLDSFFRFTTTYFVDNDPSKWGTIYKNCPVYNPDILKEENKEHIIIIISTMFTTDIELQLERMGFIDRVHYINGYDLYLFLSQRAFVCYEVLKKSDDQTDTALLKRVGTSYIDEESTFFAGDNVIHDGVSLANATLGRFTYVAHKTAIQHTDIGAFCAIGPDCLIGLGIHPSKGFISTHPAFYSIKNLGSMGSFVNSQLYQEYLPIKIGNDVWIGAKSIIMDGVEIGDGAIIAAGAVVTKDVEPYAIVAGVPARLIRKRFSDSDIEKLLNFKWWDKDIGWIRTHAHLFNDELRFMELITPIKGEN